MSQVSLDVNDWVDAKTLIALGLTEDLGTVGDLTTKAMIAPDQLGRVSIVSRQKGIICGLPLIAEIFRYLNSTVLFVSCTEDGNRVEPNQVIGYVEGPLNEILTGERTCLNFLTHLSGIATLTDLFVTRIQGTNAAILDTRKTHPGYRRLEKYAIRAGGGINHRMGLYDAIMIKDNHREAWQANLKHRSFSEAIIQLKLQHAGIKIIVEVDTLKQYEEVLGTNPDVILLDNMSTAQLGEAVSLRNLRKSAVQIEASGGVNLETVRTIAETGVDRISVGAITHSAPALDIGFDWSFA